MRVRVVLVCVFFSRPSLIISSLFLWTNARYRLKYCLEEPLNPKQPTYSECNRRTKNCRLTKYNDPVDDRFGEAYDYLFWYQNDNNNNNNNDNNNNNKKSFPRLKLIGWLVWA